MQINLYPELTLLKDDDSLLVWEEETSTTKKIKASTLKSYIGVVSGGGDVGKLLTFNANGDTNGVFYWMGTSEGTEVWSNPSDKGLIIGASGVGAGSPLSLVDRSDSEFYTANQPNSWISFYLGGKTLKCNYYSLKSRNSSSGFYPRSWKLQGSNDQNNWVDLDSQIDNTTLNGNSQWLSLPVANSSTRYTSFRILMTSLCSSNSGHLVLGEVELYGTYLD
ncbi:MAG: discoidin domain-containing protein [Nostoc desertorum CM1-VF14]|jgi:hypothetical protein|nr:discoidin domain-containing protein [Nostoc desertorum CM1-VF14]